MFAKVIVAQNGQIKGNHPCITILLHLNSKFNKDTTMRTLKLAIRRLRINKKKLQFEKVSFPWSWKLESLFQTHAASTKRNMKKLARTWLPKKVARKLLCFVLQPFRLTVFLAYFRRKMGFFEFLAILAKKCTINYGPIFCAISKVTPLKIKPQ